jgi:hypothetical protein
MQYFSIVVRHGVDEFVDTRPVNGVDVGRLNGMVLVLGDLNKFERVVLARG